MKTLHTLKLNLHYLMFRRCFIFCDFEHVSSCLSSDILVTSFKIKERQLFPTHQPFGTSCWQELVLTFVPWEFWLSECKWHSARRNTFSGISARLSLRAPCRSRANLRHSEGTLFPLPATHRCWPSMSQSGEPFQKNKPSNCLGKGVDFSPLWKNNFLGSS